MKIPQDVYTVNILWYLFYMTETYHHGNLRSDLISSGLRMLNRDGITSFSLRKLSLELGVSHAAAYRHFSDKEDLLRAIFLESSRMFRDALSKSVSPNATGEEALMQLGSGYVHFYLEHPEILGLFSLVPSEQNLLASLFQGMKADATGDTDDCREIGIHSDFPDIEALPQNSAFGLFRSIASAAGDLEPYRGLTEREILLGFWSKVHGMAVLLVTQKNFIPADQMDAVIDRVLRTPF